MPQSKGLNSFVMDYPYVLDAAPVKEPASAASPETITIPSVRPGYTPPLTGAETPTGSSFVGPVLPRPIEDPYQPIGARGLSPSDFPYFVRPLTTPLLASRAPLLGPLMNWLDVNYWHPGAQQAGLGFQQIVGTDEVPRQTVRGLTNVIGGGGQFLTPLAVGAVGAGTAVGGLGVLGRAGLGYGAAMTLGPGAEILMRDLGLSEDESKLVGQLVGMGAGWGASRAQVMDAIFKNLPRLATHAIRGPLGVVIDALMGRAAGTAPPPTGGAPPPSAPRPPTPRPTAPGRVAPVSGAAPFGTTGTPVAAAAPPPATATFGAAPIGTTGAPGPVPPVATTTPQFTEWGSTGSPFEPMPPVAPMPPPSAPFGTTGSPGPVTPMPPPPTSTLGYGPVGTTGWGVPAPAEAAAPPVQTPAPEPTPAPAPEPTPKPTPKPPAKPEGGVTVPAGTEGADWVREGNKIFTTRELDDMGHGKGRDLDLADSPTGESAHPNLSRAAKSNFDVKSWSHLRADEKMEVIKWMDDHRNDPNPIPENGELRKAKAK